MTGDVLHFYVALHFADGVTEEQYAGESEEKAIRALHSTIPVVDVGEWVTFEMRNYGGAA